MSDEARGLSLYEIETGLAEVVAAVEEAETPEEVAAVQEAIEAYAKAELTKVDSIRGYLKHCEIMADAAKEESHRLADLSKRWERREKVLKSAVLWAMNAVGKRRIEGRTGDLRVQVNGGRLPVAIRQPNLVPDEYCDGKITIAWDSWLTLLKHLEVGKEHRLFTERIIRASLIEVALSTGTAVPGCELEPRGEHLRVG
jgi:hypothetical protein